MKRLFFQLKTKWHTFKYNELNVVIPDCLDDQVKKELMEKKDYHEKAALRYILKS
ncbi:hypothetical protein [Salinibacillus xinjiangensis]|uniref:Uncharacterized protein n=1 Tax=Salinibacillus xinjiangensis TaxID=1229268 RepID=A0A6G1X1K6_9BACI|nr:hypothetical protein [Salinibacillus xinjiangensis]MRG84814.1 hypothetical protein [Salinibacillus xinjiangensis]